MIRIFCYCEIYCSNFFLFCSRCPRKQYPFAYLFHEKMILKLKCLNQIGPLIYHTKFLTPHIAVNLLDETKYSSSIYHLVTELWRYSTQTSTYVANSHVPYDVIYNLYSSSNSKVNIQETWIVFKLQLSTFKRRRVLEAGCCTTYMYVVYLIMRP